ncbi:MAG TPA: hydantoinase/carbamoylase family amidase [Gaiellaceae bacterium]|nr:hydantoinase/carbamoylase family amidase [Gaiellaceae bacterium]
MEIEVDAGLVERCILELARHGAHGDTGVWRTAYSPEWVAAQETVAGWFGEAGLEVQTDAVGNVWGRLAGTEDGPVLACGSHIDSQTPGGRYDGALGVIAALVAVRTLHERFGPPRGTVEAVSLCEEEASRFHATNFWGSRAIVGAIEPDEPERIRAADGISIGDAMRNVGLDPSRIADATRDDIGTWIELHIEQGPVLEAAGVPVGIVNAITAIRHYVVRLVGRSDHAGARPMVGRLDPMAGCAEIVTAAIGAALAVGPPAVTTVGRVDVQPNLPSAVPDEVTFTVDSRHPDPDALAQLHARQEELMREIADRRGLDITWTTPIDLAPCLCDPGVVGRLETAARAQDIPFLVMHSGAAHDTQNIARIARVAMVFARSKDGRSHTPAEFTSVEDAVAATRVLAGALHELAW